MLEYEAARASALDLSSVRDGDAEFNSTSLTEHSDSRGPSVERAYMSPTPPADKPPSSPGTPTSGRRLRKTKGESSRMTQSMDSQHANVKNDVMYVYTKSPYAGSVYVSSHARQ